MMQEINLIAAPEEAADPGRLEQLAAAQAGIRPERIASLRVKRRSIDARGGKVRFNLALELFLDGEQPQPPAQRHYRDVTHADPVVIVGAGPAGLFAAVRLIELGYKPIILERGRDVSARKHDIAAINRNEAIGDDSNYCFGEGGAGTYSDGKLFTRSKKRGDHRRAIETLYEHGASEEILYDAHPHIGTEKLPRIIRSIREKIIACGGEVHFNCRVTGLILKNGRIEGVTTLGGDSVTGIATILATGHSARDIYELLHGSGILLEPKGFAMGVRVEHPQELIDAIQYKRPQRGDYLPPAAYSLVAQVNGRGAYSFCMCPGGIIVPASTAPGEAVVNGMSASKRNTVWANSGIVTEVRPEDYARLIPQYGPLAGLKFQQEYERTAFRNGGGRQIVPAQRLTDFVARKRSHTLPRSSYHPGGACTDMNEWMPPFIASALREGFKAFGQKMRGFLTDEAAILGVESRTSSPVRIPRDRETLQHPQIAGLYPAGEGAGYAGGIISSAVDGERIAEAIAKFVSPQKAQ